MTTIAVLLIIFWLLGFISNYTIGGFSHILLIVAAILFVTSMSLNKKR